jgi:hypothetical protein
MLAIPVKGAKRIENLRLETAGGIMRSSKASRQKL